VIIHRVKIVIVQIDEFSSPRAEEIGQYSVFSSYKVVYCYVVESKRLDKWLPFN
jgi:hypothetical protein